MSYMWRPGKPGKVLELMVLTSMCDERSPVSLKPGDSLIPNTFRSCCPLLPLTLLCGVRLLFQHMTLAGLALTVPYLMSGILSALLLPSPVNSVLPSLQSPARMPPPSGSCPQSRSVGSDCTSLGLSQDFIFLIAYQVVSALCMSET